MLLPPSKLFAESELRSDLQKKWIIVNRGIITEAIKVSHSDFILIFAHEEYGVGLCVATIDFFRKKFLAFMSEENINSVIRYVEEYRALDSVIVVFISTDAVNCYTLNLEP